MKGNHQEENLEDRDKRMIKWRSTLAKFFIRRKTLSKMGQQFVKSRK